MAKKPEVRNGTIAIYTKVLEATYDVIVAQANREGRSLAAQINRILTAHARRLMKARV